MRKSDLGLAVGMAKRAGGLQVLALGAQLFEPRADCIGPHFLCKLGSRLYRICTYCQTAAHLRTQQEALSEAASSSCLLRIRPVPNYDDYFEQLLVSPAPLPPILRLGELLSSI